MDVCIRSFLAEDEVQLAKLADNPRIFKNVRDIFPSPYTLDDARAWIEFATSKKKPHTNQAIVVNGKLASCIGAAVGNDIHRISVEVGYWLGEPFWGKGIMTQALQQWIEQVWIIAPNARRLWAGVLAYNEPSMRVLEKAGFQKEAILKQAVIKNKKVCDEHIYALLRP
ncbi:GNAT family N-acetyltransferase [Siphonobacter sp. SORGH_AS_1065]|uniref:GNAT family N-acetyltransferase n=1 Tax=Siphonobacter sp. SORGH_AS_1065 TaxID=3041795 RepID=UPI002787CEA1|nr:GNAT family protein [Siphonobacter sp. SORGH_AS_1065]MDQ1085970.1 ribosomal-protein-alanine N-acetyltransferase [Siphonobacter sp. SORGH_AS_1065]